MRSILIVKGTRYAVYEDGLHGYRVVRLSDNAEAKFYGDDSCERFLDNYHGEESLDDDADPFAFAIEAGDVGEWCEREGEFPTLAHDSRPGDTNAESLVRTISNMKPSTDGDDSIATINRLIEEARRILSLQHPAAG